MYVGRHEHTLDGKNRLIIPARFRERAQGRFFLTRGTERCLCLFDEGRFQQLVDEVDLNPWADTENGWVARCLFGETVEVECDSQGRIVLPGGLVDHACLTHESNEVAVIGVISRVEIWDRRRYEERSSDIRENLDDLAGDAFRRSAARRKPGTAAAAPMQEDA